MRGEIDAAPPLRLCAGLLADAFVDEPGMRWICGPGLPRKRRWFAATTHAHVSLPGHRAYVISGDGVPVGAALAGPSGGRLGLRARVEWTARVCAGCGPGAVRRTLAYLAAVEDGVPGGAWSLEFVGVSPTARGRGAARALIERVVGDAAGADVVLTTADPANVGVYRRLGFVETGRVRLADLSVVTMRRAGST